MRDETSDRKAAVHRASGGGSDAETDAQRYWSLVIRVSGERMEQLAARLLELGFSAFEERSEPSGTCVLVYAESEERLREALRELLEGDLAGALACEITELRTDWQLTWTQHLTPIQLTRHLRVVPGVPEGAPDPSAIYLEPAFAFGFGEHPSTRVIAGWVEDACRQRPGASLLDVGSGTGVLALVAARSGAASVLGIDTSLEAVQAALRNAALNRVSNVEFIHASLDQVDGRFDIVAANVEGTVLIELRREIAQRMAPGGALALSGLIEEQAGDVIRAYADLGVRLAPQAREDEWCLLATR
jgi:ribosomal protein L11 methyltransferase